MNNNAAGGKGMGILDVILIVNIILKFIGIINWSWLVVLWPLWVILIIFFIVAKIFWKL